MQAAVVRRCGCVPIPYYSIVADVVPQVVRRKEVCGLVGTCGGCYEIKHVMVDIKRCEQFIGIFIQSEHYVRYLFFLSVYSVVFIKIAMTVSSDPVPARHVSRRGAASCTSGRVEHCTRLLSYY